jgi:hypothetical protein
LGSKENFDPALVKNGFYRIDTGLDGIGLATRNDSDGFERLIQSVSTSFVYDQVTPGIFARPYTVTGVGTILYSVCTSLARPETASLPAIEYP